MIVVKWKPCAVVVFTPAHLAHYLTYSLDFILNTLYILYLLN